MNLTLIFVVAILAGSVIYGYRRGFIKMTLASLVVVVALLFTGQVYPYVSNVLKNHTPAYDIAREQIQEYLDGEIRQQAEESMAVPELPEEVSILDQLSSNQQRQLIGAIPVPETIRETLAENNNQEIYRLMGVTSFSDYLSSYLAAMILNAVSYVLSFVVLYAMLRLAVYALDIMAKLPVLHAINKLGGVLVSLLFALLAVWVFFLAATAASGTAFGREVLSSVQESRFLSFLYNRNLLIDLVMDIGKLMFR